MTTVQDLVASIKAYIQIGIEQRHENSMSMTDSNIKEATMRFLSNLYLILSSLLLISLPARAEQCQSTVNKFTLILAGKKVAFKTGFIESGRMRYRYIAKGDQTRPLMLFLHGFPEIAEAWAHQIKQQLNQILPTIQITPQPSWQKRFMTSV